MASPEEHALITTDPSELADTDNAGEAGLDLADAVIAPAGRSTEEIDFDDEHGDDRGDGDTYVDVQAA
ncbi:hypothetical protein [Nocardia jinanensis]|uniref:Uncharacterized protein n=1 Tax=Nocardia jinanensis TaxID=382504 RepID=A0A917RRU7_9NOCA|nr:hypothetical protein [Nocardia jinanensis]GGL20660.1 hypothetical protein GCM10011588_39400 [Nocardia jinanensis]